MAYGAVIAAALPYIIQGVKGYQQSREAKKLRDTERPDKEINPAEIDRLKLAMKNYSQGAHIPGEDEFFNRIDASTATAMSNAIERGVSPAAAMSAINQFHRNSLDAKGRVYDKGLARMDSNQAQLDKVLQSISGEQTKMFDWNQKQPYLDAMRASAYLSGASTQNLYGAAAGMGQLYVAGAQNGQFGGGAGGGGGDYNLVDMPKTTSPWGDY